MTRAQIIETVARGVFEHWQFQAGKVLAVAWVAGGNSIKQDEARDYATAALSALEAAGLAVVPTDATEDQLEAAVAAMRKPRLRLNYTPADDLVTLCVAYKAMTTQGAQKP